MDNIGQYLIKLRQKCCFLGHCVLLWLQCCRTRGSCTAGFSSRTNGSCIASSTHQVWHVCTETQRQNVS